jgi:hypothetical protein
MFCAGAKFFVPDQIIDLHIVLVPFYCAKPKDDNHLVSLVLVPAPNFLEQH